MLPAPLCLLTMLSPLASAFYLPGVAPTDYKKDYQVPLYVNSLTPSTRNADQNLHAVAGFDYYHPMFNFCRPKNGPQHVSESLGSILFGDRILTSPFELKMLKNETCKKLCGPTKYSPKQANFISRRIWQNYNVNLLVDGLPAAIHPAQDREFITQGFPLGALDMSGVENGETAKPVVYFFNHYDFYIDYHTIRGINGEDRYRVVGVSVDPKSRNSEPDDSKEFGANCEDTTLVPLNLDRPTELLFTYSVFWKHSKTPWATRWDKYLGVTNPNIHWFSLVNSVIIVVFLTSMVAMVLLRALRKDITRYNQLDLNEDVQDDSGWKLVHGDVFRPPKNPMLLSIFLGSGSQLFFMVGVTIVLALLGFLSPSNRGGLGTVAILLYTLLGFVGGYISARVYKTLGGEAWKQNIIYTPVFVPGIVFGTFFLLNLFLVFKQSSGAVPFSTMLALIGIWFVISLPLSFFGSWLGFKAPILEAPVRTNQIPRQIPPPLTYLRPIPSMLLAGILPFAAIFVELYFIMNSIWFHMVYYMFGFLFVCYGIMIVTCATVTILMIYFLLCSENYHWQWRSFFTAGACSFYIFLNAIIYWISKLSLESFAGNVLFMGYSLLIVFLFFILTGTIGFFASYFFVRKIYSHIKIE